MAESIKDKAAHAGQKIADTAKTVGHKIAEGADKATDTAKTVGHKIAEGAEKATDWVKEKTHVGKGALDTTKMASGSEKTANIREHMPVVASCGKHVGTVDHVEGNVIKLTKSDPTSGGQHHFIPMDWICSVDQSVHLNKNSAEVFTEWKAE